MSSIPVETFCPLGSKCEEVKDGKIIRCAWMTKLIGKDPQSNKEIDEWACAMAWMPIMMVENSQRVRGMTQATESFRNETIKKYESQNIQQGIFNELIAVAIDKSLSSEKKLIEG